MLFNSYEFIFLFLPATLLIYYRLAKSWGAGTAKNFLIAASLFFYSYWDIGNLPVLLLSVAVNFLAARALYRKRSRKILFLGIFFNLAFLGFFKYTDFILSNINGALGLALPLQNIVLPLGISFFTFTQTAYLVDVYKGETRSYSHSDYLLFVTIFPHLIAGPILYHKDMVPQFSRLENYRVNYANLSRGLGWFVIGLFKKVVIADKLAVWAGDVFNNISAITMLDAWGGSVAYTLQLYFDFSGYSEMAIGLGLMLNFKLPLNFNMPYASLSIIEFWRRWHMTLSAFLKNYLYIPLGGNRNGHHLRNILITMFLGGLWHGAGWTFIFWGLLHGVYICINHLWRKTGIVLPKFLCWLLTFNAVNIAWVFFRAENFDDALAIVRRMFDISSFGLPYSRHLKPWMLEMLPVGYENILDFSILFSCLGFGLLCLKWADTQYLMERFKPAYWRLLLLLAMAVYAVTRFAKASEFIYFQF